MSKNNKNLQIVAYNPLWADYFQKIRKILNNKLGKHIKEIKHLGSTSIQGIPAKPILDIFLIADSKKDFNKLKNKLKRMGYEHFKSYKKTDCFSRNNAFSSYNGKDPDWPPQHLFLCERNSKRLKESLEFNQLLRKDSDLKNKYRNYKIDIAEKYKNNKKKYEESKNKFIKETINNNEEL